MIETVLSLALLATGALAQNSTKCTDSLYILVARGTGEDAGTGAFGTIADSIAAEIEDSIVEALDYPATFTDPIYTTSEQEGVSEMHDVLTAYHKACPDAKFAVLGYSQGGQVATDTFCGGEGGEFSSLAAMSTDFVKSYVAAIVAFGDPSHVANTTYDRGTSINDGIFERSDNNVTFCEKNYNDRFRSFCDTGDVYCDSGDDSDVHGSYFDTYGDVVVDFVVERYKALESSASSTASASASASTATSTSTSTSTSAAAATNTDNAAADIAPRLAVVMAPLMLGALMW